MDGRILIVEDDEEIAALVELYLKDEGFTVNKFGSAVEALEHLNGSGAELALLDVLLPDMDGFTLCRRIREKHSFPVIMLTSRTTSQDKVLGLACGADDYVTKPFDPLELCARVRAQLRRYIKYNRAAGENVLRAGSLSLRPEDHSCWVKGLRTELTPTEFNILRILCLRKNQAVSSEELFHELWGEEYFCKRTNPIPVHIRHIREKIGDSYENPRYIKTVWGVGYKIEG